MYQNNYGGNGQNMNRSNNQNRPQKKRSGAKMGVGKNGVRYISGWNYSRRNGLVTVIASQRKGGKDKTGVTRANETQNQKGEMIEIWVCTVKVGMQQYTYTGFFKNGKLRIPELGQGMTINPSAPNGGYFGKTNVSRK